MRQLWKATVGAGVVTVIALAVACGSARVNVEPGRFDVVEGEALSFRVEASGPRIDRVILDYGDGHTDTTTSAGAITVTSVFQHTYRASGGYRARARAIHSLGHTVSRAVRIRVRSKTTAGSTQPTNPTLK